MSDRILAVEEKAAVEQVSAYLKMLTPEQQRDFELLIRGAMVTVQLMDKDKKKEEPA